MSAFVSARALAQSTDTPSAHACPSPSPRVASFATATSSGAVSAAPCHAFFDRRNLLMTGIEAAALGADGATTMHALRKYPGELYEGDPITRPFVSHGWPGQIAGGGVVIAADVGLRYLLHRTGHHTAEHWLPLVLTACGTFGALHNAHVMNQVAQSR